MVKVNSKDQRNLLVIEPMGAGGELLLRSVRQSGYRAIVATTPEVHRDSLGAVEEYLDDVIYINFSDPVKATEELVEADSDFHFAGVVVSWEFLTEVAASVAAKLGLRGPVAEKARTRRNKHAMANAWLQAGVPVPRLLAAFDPDSGDLDASDLTYPVVVKPAENSASFGVTVVDSSAGLSGAIKRASRWTHEFPHGIPFDRTILVQEYLPGQEFSVEAISDGGRFFVWGVTMKFTTDGGARAETGHIFPAPIDSILAHRIIDVARAGVEALGVTDGISHTEVKLDVSGNPHLIESGPRPAGDFIPQLVALATGQNLLDIYVQQATAGLPDDFIPTAPKRSAGIQFFRAPRAGKFQALEFPEMLSNAQIVESRVTVQPGEVVAPGSTNMDRVGWALVVGEDGNAVHAALNELQRDAVVVLS